MNTIFISSHPCFTPSNLPHTPLSISNSQYILFHYCYILVYYCCIIALLFCIIVVYEHAHTHIYESFSVTWLCMCLGFDNLLEILFKKIETIYLFIIFIIIVCMCAHVCMCVWDACVWLWAHLSHSVRM